MPFGPCKGSGLFQFGCRTLTHPVCSLRAPFFLHFVWFLFMGWEQFSPTGGNGSGRTMQKPRHREIISAGEFNLSAVCVLFNVPFPAQLVHH